VSIHELQAVLPGTETVDGFPSELAALAARTLGEGLPCVLTLQPNGRSSLSMPLFASERSVGAFNLYSDGSGFFWAAEPCGPPG
jgi:hypothetical protein